MAKVKAPLMSFGASGAIADSLVFFGWKGLDVVRSYTVPANPRSTAQVTQRGFMSVAVAAIHAAQADGSNPLNAADVAAYSLKASTNATPRTWFNEIVKDITNSKVAGGEFAIFSEGSGYPGAGTLEVAVNIVQDSDAIAAGNFLYGTSKTALINTAAATVVAGEATATLSGLSNGTKYFFKFVPTTPGYAGVTSGIYYGTPAA